MSFISALKLSNFRCYDSARLNDLCSGLVVLSGANGAGKTNILEAVSLLCPGRGLRMARPAEIQKNDQYAQGWAVAADVQGAGGQTKLGTGLDARLDKRVVRINGVTAKGQNALADYLACIWLTPQMDRLFMDSGRERRRFLDRMVFAFDPGHSGRVSRYDNAMSQRSKLLKEGRADLAWIKSLEAQMAETGVSIAAARLDFTARLQRACEKEDHAHFPLARIRAGGTIEELLSSAPALEVEDMFKYQLEQTRQADAITGGAATGPHKGDLVVHMAEKQMPADQCSTGEQKALLIGLILAHARLIAAERGAPPVLLLDEVAAHLDEGRRGALYEILQELGGQVWLTGTEESLFSSIRASAQFFDVKDARVKCHI
ncbi:MAG: DNA replication/repair protein RecF [Alphaproteobacteria bacterium]|nr:DNA replication/repair protein RecF [Alphaproteobacteria bacterium]|tara:strand:+ start:12670 stop:13791 length:1122 start_codon:yes stop_codon:yes gene_type:complete